MAFYWVFLVVLWLPMKTIDGQALVYEANVLHHDNFDQELNALLEQQGYAIRHRWSVEQRTIWSEVLVTTDNPDGTRVVISDHKLTDDEYEATLDAWENRRQDFTYLRLSCQQSTTGQNTSDAHVSCICAGFVRNDDAKSNTIDSWFLLRIEKCSMIPRLQNSTFANMNGVKTFELSDVVFSEVESGVFSRMAGLEIIVLENVFMASSSLQAVAGSFCGGQFDNLTAVQMTNVRLLDSVEQNQVLEIIRCTDPNEVDDISVLTISNCDISTLTSDTFSSLHMQTLLSIDLSNNRISSIDEVAFTIFVNLYELILTNNRLMQLPPGLLHGLGQLLYLDLAGNLMETFSTILLQGSPMLRLLNLADNRLQEIDGSFTTCPKIINIINNAMQEIRADTFQNCKSIGRLSLNNNSIHELSTLAFRDVLNFTYFEMTHNMLYNATALKETFSNTHINHLLYIDLRHNFLSELLSDMFQPNVLVASSLLELHLSFNHISWISPDAFRGLTNLTGLTLDNNVLTTIDKSTFRDLKSLETLFLFSNRLVTLHADTFLTNSRMRVLVLQSNNLTSIPDKIAMPESIEYLIVSNNLLTALPLFRSPLLRLRMLDISDNRVSSISRERMTLIPNIYHLFLNNNTLTHLPARVFADNPGISALLLNDNQLDIDFSVELFDDTLRVTTFTLPVVMYVIDLSNNRIRSVRDLFSSMTFCRSMEVILSDNPIRSLGALGQDTDTCPILFLRSMTMINCSLTTISEWTFYHAPHLESLDVGFNRLTEFKPLQMTSRAYVIQLFHNPIRCTCRMKWLKSEQFLLHYELDMCIDSVTGQFVDFETLPVSQFLCKANSQCLVDEKRCDCYSDDESRINDPTHLVCSQKGLIKFPSNIQSSIRIIYCDGNNLSTISAIDMTTLGNISELYLDNNRIAALGDGTFKHSSNLRILSLSSNQLTRISNAAFIGLKRLRRLLLNNNHLSVIEPLAFVNLRDIDTLSLHSNDLGQLDIVTLDELDALRYMSNLSLGDNPWSCPCDNATFKNWIQTHVGVIPDSTSIHCNGTSILTMSDEDFDCYGPRIRNVDNYLTGPLSVSTSLAFFLLLIVVCLVVAYRHRHLLQVKLYNTRFRFRLRQPVEVATRYDAVILYDPDNDDVRQWVEDQLRPRLLQFEPRLQLFVPDLDWPLNYSQHVNIIADGVTESRRTVIVVDEGSYVSQYVSYAFLVAYQRMTTDDRLHQILLVLTDNLNLASLLADDNVDANFKAHLRAGKRLMISDRRFWEELNFFMPQPRADRLAIADNDSLIYAMDEL